MTASLLIASVLLSSAVSVEEPTLNDKLVAWSKKQVGRIHGRGECTDFILTGLKTVGANTNSSYRNDPGDGDYVWGKLIGTVYIDANKKRIINWVDPKIKAKAGDVLQMRNVKLRVPRTSVPAQFPHHTAILEKVTEDMKRWTFLHQNVNGKKNVQRHTFQIVGLRSGWIAVYRPQPKK